jgi:subtilisin family serine protease
VRARWLGLAALVVVVAASAAGGIRAQRAFAAPPDAYVVVQYNTGRTIQDLDADGLPPTLAEQGYRQLAVPAGMTAEEFSKQLKSQPGVLYAEPEGLVYAAALPNDPYYSRDQAPYLSQIGAPDAWDVETGSNQVIVAVLDTGLDLGHPDFEGRLWENPVDNKNDGVDRDGNKCTNDRYGCRFINLTPARAQICGYTDSLANGNVQDDHRSPGGASHSHGTLVSGIIGAAGNNGQGVAGVAWNVRLMTVKVLDCGAGEGFGPSGDPFNVAQGIEYAVRMGARVINLSLATPAGSQQGDIPYLRDTLQMAQNAGVIVVAAAGNHVVGSSAVGTGYPAAYTQYPNVIAVGASDNRNGNVWASYSNYGPAIDFAAPGNLIASTARTDIGLAQPYAQEDPGGTSFATPLVSGMFALMIGRNSRLPTSDLIQIARDTATPAQPAPHGQNWAGSGIINIGAAVARVPMTMSGAPLKDWRDVPAGTTVDATIDGNLCGTTKSDAFGLLGRYDIRIRSTAEQTGCGQPGKTVQLFVGGAPAVPTFTWGARNDDLSLPNRDISSVSPPPGQVVVQTLNGSWSNIAQLEPGGQLPGAASGLPTPWNSIFLWDPLKKLLDLPGAYRRFLRQAPSYASDLPVIGQYDPIWVDAPATNMASLNPQPAPGRTIQLHTGWNNFTYTGTSRSVADALGGIAGTYVQVLQFDNASGTWLSYLPGQARYLNDFGGLFTLKVYWVKVTSDVTLVMN